MNSKLALSTIIAVAAIMALGVISPAMAAPNENANDRAKERAGEKGNDKAKAGKVSICHWQEEELLLDENDEPVLDVNGEPIVLEEAQWVIINISKNAQKAHVDVHTDGTDFDKEIDDSEEPAEDTITSNECLVERNSSEEPEPIPEEA